MSELPPRPPRDEFNGSLGDRFVMDYLRVMANIGHHLLGKRQVEAFVKSGMSTQEAHEMLECMTRIAQKTLTNQVKGITAPPRPTREALARAEISRRSQKMKPNKPKFLLIDGDKE